MKKLVVNKNVECMACLECVRACSEAYYKEFHQDLAALKIVAKGTGAKPQVCIQCGKCMKACEHGAITQNAKGVYMINKKLCVGCGACAAACPMKVIVLQEGSAASKCTSCGICVKNCPMGVLSVEEK